MSHPLDISSDKQLFIDDYCVAELSGVRRQLNQAKKHPANPLLVPEMPWEEAYVQVYGNVLYDIEQRLYRMWYSARCSRRNNTICHATSTDGIHWERSRLSLIEHEGTKPTNILLKGQYIGPTVFHTPEDPDPRRRYRMFVFMGPELLNDEARKTAFKNSYGVLFSPDGIHWTEYEHNPVIQGGDIATCAYDSVTNEYIAFPKMQKSDDGIGRRCAGFSISKDFMNWSTPELILSADAIDDARVEARLNRFRNILCYDNPLSSYYSADIYGMTGFRYEGLRLGLMWFYDRSALCPPEYGGNDDGVINIQLAYQRDGYWQRAGDRQDFLPCGDEVSHDRGMIVMAHSVVEVEHELWFYYTGVDRSHGDYGEERCEHGQPLPRIKTSSKGASINLATLRRDGFISIDASYPPGSLTTRLLIFKGDELEINADAEHGQIVVEVLDEAGEPVSGYSRDDCVPFKEDAVCGAIQWGSGRTLTALQGKPIRLVFFMQTAKLYAFKFV